MIKELFTKWLMERQNSKYLSELSNATQPENPSQSSSTTAIILKSSRQRPEPNCPKPQIKPFYLRKRSATSIKRELEHITEEYTKVLSKYNANDKGLNRKQFEIVTVDICGLSKYCTVLLFNKILSSTSSASGVSHSSSITLSMFVQFWRTFFAENDDIVFRFIQILKQKQANDFLIRSDFIPLIQEILFHHPGLDFLRDAAEFHQYYITTVICRIFYYLDSNKNNQICTRELRRSNFLDILFVLDEEEDINEIFDYFSYEHFYVIYSKFWQLDEDGDNLLSKDDLIKYGDFALTPKVIDRIMNGSANVLTDQRKNEAQKMKMNYEEFVEFIIAEEDKTSATALKYWFRILDLDGDGILSPYELKIFFDEQSAKILKICGETVSFENILRLLNDMISPKWNFKFTMRDIKKSRMGHLFFNTLININKFALSEQKDVELINEIRNSPHMTDWDRFASREYFLLSNS
eukprot:258948_1